MERFIRNNSSFKSELINVRVTCNSLLRVAVEVSVAVDLIKKIRHPWPISQLSSSNLVKLNENFSTQYNHCDDFVCVNILEDRAQWCDKTKGLSNLIII